VNRLREAFRYAKQKRPFSLDAIAVLPDHLHCLWTLQEEADFSTRWQLVKTHFSRQIVVAKKQNGAKLVWQPRFWEHFIRDKEDLRRHLDYIHYNPVKHGYVNSAAH
jgi:putative transposase